MKKRAVVTSNGSYRSIRAAKGDVVMKMEKWGKTEEKM